MKMTATPARTAGAGERMPSERRLPRLAALAGGTGEGSSLRFVTLGWDALDSLRPHSLALTYWFDALPEGEPYSVSVRFTGKRLDVAGKPGVRDTFQVTATMKRVLPGSGRVALTLRVPDKAPGRWKVTAEAYAMTPTAAGAKVTPRRLPNGTATGVSIYERVARVRAPGVVLGAWPALVALGVIAALLLQSALAAQRGLPVPAVLLLALLASAVGLVGAKVYYRITHLEEKVRLLTAGMSIQGFVIAAIATFVLGAVVARIPVGPLLDVTVASLLLGQAVGRLGCFFAGCCAGLPTASRLGLWSSDRQVGVRRIPVQFMESVLAASLALGAALAVLTTRPRVDGLVFVAAFALYVIGRQVLFPLRGLPRKTAHGRQVTLATAGAVLLASLALAVPAW